ncbi:MAG: GTP-binding protein [Promethearchaeota archaeon]|nr:MAG: GTP-binding protein [Candidatus Lokiarchaeota archaeon]
MYFVISYFNQILGPQIFSSVPQNLSGDLRENVLKFMNFESKKGLLEGYLLNQEYKIINYFIEVPSEWARGDNDILMVSLCLEQNYKFEIFQEDLEKFKAQLKDIPNLYKAFYKDSPDHIGDKGINEIVSTLEELISKYYKKIKRITENPYLGTFLTLGLSQAGKSTIIHYLRTNAFKDMKPTLALKVIKILFDNKIFQTVDVSGQKRLRKQWWSYTKNPDGIIFVIDINDSKERLKEVKSELLKLEERILNEETEITNKIPILICFNKIDLLKEIEPRLSRVKEILNLEEIDLNYKIQLTSAKTGNGITEGIKWMFQELLKIS